MAEPKRYSPFVLTPEEIAFVAQKAAIVPSSVPTAVAIALAESGGNIYALNAFGRDESYGLWQINMKGALGEERRPKFKLASNEDLYDPLHNAVAMGNISQGGSNWKAWSVYNSGAYLTHLGAARKAAQAPQDYLPRLNKDVVGRVEAGQNPLEQLMSWVEGGVLRAAGFIGGGVLVIVAIALYVRSKT